MENIIHVSVKNKIAVQTGEVSYICGNSGYTVEFAFDDEWNDYETKTARFIYDGKITDVVFTGNVCAVPVISNVIIFAVGVFAGNLQTTTPAFISAKKSILCGGGSPADPPDDVYNQIIDMLNNLGETGIATNFVKTVNGIEPDKSGNVEVGAMSDLEVSGLMSALQ